MLCILPLAFSSKFLPMHNNVRHDSRIYTTTNDSEKRKRQFQRAQKFMIPSQSGSSNAWSRLNYTLHRARFQKFTSICFSYELMAKHLFFLIRQIFIWKDDAIGCINQWRLKQFVNKWEIIVRWPICDIVRETLQLALLLLLWRLLHFSAGLSWLFLLQVGSNKPVRKKLLDIAYMCRSLGTRLNKSTVF